MSCTSFFSFELIESAPPDRAFRSSATPRTLCQAELLRDEEVRRTRLAVGSEIQDRPANSSRSTLYRWVSHLRSKYIWNLRIGRMGVLVRSHLGHRRQWRSPGMPHLPVAAYLHRQLAELHLGAPRPGRRYTGLLQRSTRSSLMPPLPFVSSKATLRICHSFIVVYSARCTDSEPRLEKRARNEVVQHSHGTPIRGTD